MLEKKKQAQAASSGAWLTAIVKCFSKGWTLCVWLAERIEQIEIMFG